MYILRILLIIVIIYGEFFSVGAFYRLLWQLSTRFILTEEKIFS